MWSHTCEAARAVWCFGFVIVIVIVIALICYSSIALLYFEACLFVIFRRVLLLFVFVGCFLISRPLVKSVFVRYQLWSKIYIHIFQYNNAQTYTIEMRFIRIECSISPKIVSAFFLHTQSTQNTQIYICSLCSRVDVCGCVFVSYYPIPHLFCIALTSLFHTLWQNSYSNLFLNCHLM